MDSGVPVLAISVIKCAIGSFVAYWAVERFIRPQEHFICVGDAVAD